MNGKATTKGRGAKPVKRVYFFGNGKAKATRR